MCNMLSAMTALACIAIIGATLVVAHDVYQ